MYHTKAFFLNNQNFIKMRLQRLDPGGNTRKLSKDRLTTDKYNVTWFITNYHVTRTAPRTVSLENHEKRVPRVVRVKSKGPGKTRTVLLEKRSQNEVTAAMNA